MVVGEFARGPPQRRGRHAHGYGCIALPVGAVLRPPPDLRSLGYIPLPVPLNCAWGVLSDGPHNAAAVVNLLKISVRKADTEVGYIPLPVPLNCAWGVLSDGPHNAAAVVNLLKISVRKADTEEYVESRSVMHWASMGQPLFQQ